MIDLRITGNLDNMDNIFKNYYYSLIQYIQTTDSPLPLLPVFQNISFFSDQFFSPPPVSRKEPTSQGHQPNMTQKDIIKLGKKFHIKAGENILINEKA